MENQIDPRAEYVIALDVGGTSVKSGIVARGGRVIYSRVNAIESDASADVILEAFAKIIEQQRVGMAPANVRGIAFGFPGPFDYENGISLIEGLSKFANLYGVNVKTELHARFELPILMRNDAEAAIVGEVRYGAGQNLRRLIGVTLGTGFGSAFLVNGVRVSAGRGVPPDGWLYPLLFQGQRADDTFSIRGLRTRAERADIHFDDPKQLAQRAREGDSAARALLIQFGTDLGKFLQPFPLDFEAEAVLILGGLAGAFELFKDALRTRLTVPALPSQLGSRAALLGAAELFFEKDKS